ncbi:MAG: menaquinone biosynthesis protein [Desulfovibrio sp.]|nr:menaquinone biosynthesis protein [Desulfovibrio sp.]
MGRIAFLNVLPVYYALEAGIIAHDFELVRGTPAELNRLTAAGELDAASVSCVEYARRPERYLLLRDLSISSDGPVRSVLLLSRFPVETLRGRSILFSAQSHTSVLLLRLLLAEVYGVTAFSAASGQAAEELGAGRFPDAFLAIGDEALRLSGHPQYPYRLDLGQVWREHTGFPFVFGLWIALRRAGENAAEEDPGALLRASRDYGRGHMEEILRAAARSHPFMTSAEHADYFACLKHSLGEREQAGLKLFWSKLADAGELPGVPELEFYF